MKRSESLAHMSWWLVVLAISLWALGGSELFTATAVICSAVTRVGSMILRDMGR